MYETFHNLLTRADSFIKILPIHCISVTDLPKTLGTRMYRVLLHNDEVQPSTLLVGTP